MDTMTAQRIGDVTPAMLGGEPPDWGDFAAVAFRVACTAYALQYPGLSDRAAIDVIWGDGDFWPGVREWAPRLAAEVEAAPGGGLNPAKWPPGVGV